MKKIKIESPIRFVMFVLILILLISGVVYGCVYLYKNMYKDKVTSTQTLLDEVGRLVILPEGEEPSMATVTDLGPLEGQDFFKNAQIGDKLLVFSTSQKAILYRPSTKSIVEIAPINSNKP